MNRLLVSLFFPLLFAAGCAHTPAVSTIPTLPASHGQLSLALARHLKLPVSPSASVLPGDAPAMVVTAAQAPSVLAEALQVLEGRPTPQQVREASEDLGAACDAGLGAACDFLRDRFKGPERLDGQLPSYPALAIAHKAFGMAVVLCRLGIDGRFHTCDVLERTPYGFTEDVLESIKTMRYQPATLAGNPIEIPYLFSYRMAPSNVKLTDPEQLRWARQRVEAFPRSAPAWLELAEQLAKQAPEEPEYLLALEKLHALDSRFWWSAGELAWTHAQAGEYADAAEFLRAARKGAPLNPYVLETAAAVAFGLGECAKALADQRTAVEQLPADWPAAEREHFQQQLQAYAEQCAPPPAP